MLIHEHTTNNGASQQISITINTDKNIRMNRWKKMQAIDLEFRLKTALSIRNRRIIQITSLVINKKEEPLPLEMNKFRKWWLLQGRETNKFWKCGYSEVEETTITKNVTTPRPSKQQAQKMLTTRRSSERQSQKMWLLGARVNNNHKKYRLLGGRVSNNHKKCDYSEVEWDANNPLPKLILRRGFYFSLFKKNPIFTVSKTLYV